MLNVAAKNGIKFKWSKCQFLQNKIEFLGFIIENGTIKPSPNKKTAVSKFPEPKNVQQIQNFLGITGFFRKCMPNYGRISAPLSNLLKKDIKLSFGPIEINAFNKLKTLLTTEPVLHLFKPNLETAQMLQNKDTEQYYFKNQTLINYGILFIT